MAKRRSNGEGSLRLRADGRWEMTISDGYRDDGKHKTKTFYRKTQKEVKNKAKAYQMDKEAGLIPDVRYRFSDWADQWFEHHKYNISETTQENYSYTLRILKSEFGRRWVSDIKAYDIEVFLQKLRRDGKSDSCLSHCRGMMFQIMKRAEANDYIRKNPVRLAEKMRQKGPVQMKDAFTAEEVRALMNGLPDDRIGQSIRLMNGTGIRMQELLALGVDLATIRSLVGHADIDMTQHYLHVQESIRQDAIARFSEAFPAAAE